MSCEFNSQELSLNGYGTYVFIYNGEPTVETNHNAPQHSPVSTATADSYRPMIHVASMLVCAGVMIAALKKKRR